MELRGKTVGIVGLGKSGLAAGRLCAARGARVFGVDDRPRADLEPALDSAGIAWRDGGVGGASLADADVVVVSPGVPDGPALQAAVAAGKLVIGEMDLAARFVSAPIVAVGGTNGKSTVTELVAQMLVASGRRVFAGANLGRPAAEAVDSGAEIVVFEVSSFQLERAPAFRPKVSVLLNVSEDHLDRYPSFRAYADAKGNAFVNQTPEDVAVVPEGDTVCAAQAARGRGRTLTFGGDGDYAVRGRTVTERTSGATYDLATTRLHGRHNVDNAAAAIAAALAAGASAESIRSALSAFVPLPHRMALVAELGGVRFYDDSKGTNVGAAVTALSGLHEARGVLIAGGRDKQGSYQPLVDALRDKGRAVVVIGEAAERIAAAVGDAVPLERATDMSDAVERAHRLARPGDAVLLSPACSSFDMFQSYADRGDRFVQAVQSLVRRESGKAVPS